MVSTRKKEEMENAYKLANTSKQHDNGEYASYMHVCMNSQQILLTYQYGAINI